MQLNWNHNTVVGRRESSNTTSQQMVLPCKSNRLHHIFGITPTASDKKYSSPSSIPSVSHQPWNFVLCLLKQSTSAENVKNQNNNTPKKEKKKQLKK